MLFWQSPLISRRIGGKFIRVGILGAAIAGVLWTTSARAEEQAYDFRGVALGIELSKFKLLRHPDNSAAKILCSDEPSKLTGIGGAVVDLFPPKPIGEPDKPLTILCTWFAPHTLMGTTSWSKTTISVGGRYSFILYKFFSPSGKVRPELYEIELTTATDYFEFLAGLYRNKFGAPTKDASGATQTVGGAWFDDRVIVWSNESSSLYMEQRGVDSRTMRITYRHKALAEALEKRRLETFGDPRKKL